MAPTKKRFLGPLLRYGRSSVKAAKGLVPLVPDGTSSSCEAGAGARIL